MKLVKERQNYVKKKTRNGIVSGKRGEYGSFSIKGGNKGISRIRSNLLGNI